MKTQINKTCILLLASFMMFVVGCTKDDSPGPELDENGEVVNPEQGGQIVSGDSSLNSFLITSNDESVVTVDAQSGQEQVIFTFEDLTNIEVLPEYNNGKIFVTTDDNAVNAIGPDAKNLIWDTPMLDYKFSSLGLTPPVCIDGVCYASGGFGVVVALDENTGDLKWYYATDPEGELDNVLNEAETPIVRGDKVYIFTDEGFISDLLPYLHILDKNTGQLLQKLELPFEVTGIPVFEENTLYLPAKNMYALDVETFAIKWMFEADGVSTPSILNGRMAFQANPLDDSISSVLYCLDADSGNLQWQVDTGFDNIWSPIIIKNVVFGIYDEASQFAFSRNGRPFAVSLDSGRQLWYRDNVSVDHSPVYANGRLFFHGHDIGRSDDTDNNVGLLSMDANTGEVLWLNNSFRYQRTITPLVVAENGVFGPSYYRGK